MASVVLLKVRTRLACGQAPLFAKCLSNKRSFSPSATRPEVVPSQRLRRSAEDAPSTPAPPTPAPPTGRPTGCELASLSVDFEAIGWAWVVYPTQYDAHHCVGQCSFPLGQEVNPTNHATVVSIVHFSASGPESVRNPACVPTAYETLAVLYYDEEETVILKRFDRMIATQCGCR